MKLTNISPRGFINPLLSKKSVDADKFSAFKEAFAAYAAKIDAQHTAKQTEPNIVSNALKPFLESFGYDCGAVSQHGQSGIDLAVLKGGKTAVIIEAKVATSKDMITEANVNTKALHEAVLYFMRERDRQNNALFHVVITNFYDWHIFDAKDFDRLFWKNPVIQKIWKDYRNPSLLDGDKTSTFYHLLSQEIPKLKRDLVSDEELEDAYFKVAPGMGDKDLLAIYKLLGADNLLKEFNPNDANSLDRHFYTELLYILGLEEVRDKGKKLIKPAAKPQPGSIYENAQAKLAQQGSQADFDATIKLIIIWINRIIFAKLLESQIVRWTRQPNDKFLHHAKIDSFGKLQSLFFGVLGTRPDRRTPGPFNYIPYLNSSLFEAHPDEKDGIFMSTLDSDAEIQYHRATVVKDGYSKPRTGAARTLAYLFEFLDAYDFSNEGGEELVSESKSLISASVLGLIFEKINGYKDGSFYTPSFITMSMAHDSIRQTILERFCQAFPELQGADWPALVLYCEKRFPLAEFRATASALIDSITICDPAVGSGHFLVSALNELILCKFELGLFNQKGLELTVANDELLIRLEDEWFEYARPKDIKHPGAVHKLQKALFLEKQRIIENQLFGVDINPNSTQITKLRLWIELLKHSYYDEQEQLVTLPNIDINIKTGNSLINRFDLDDALGKKNIKAEIADYKDKVTQYKENIGAKKDVIAAIDKLKASFNADLKKGHKKATALDRKLLEYIKLFELQDLNVDLATRAVSATQGQFDMFGADQVIADKNKAKKRGLLVELNALEKSVRDLENGQIYRNAFEWRIEFPEILGDDGAYQGFDIVIGNPPYGVKLSDAEKAGLLERFVYQDYQLDTYLLFIELGLRILRKGGKLSFIVPNTWLANLKYKKIRAHIIRDNFIHSISHYRKAIFDEAVVDTQTLFLEKRSAPNNKIAIRIFDAPRSFTKQVRDQAPWAAACEQPINLFANGDDLALKALLETNTKPLGTLCNLVVGVKPYQAGKGNPKQTKADGTNRVFDADHAVDASYKPLIRGNDIRKYSVKWNGKRWIKYGKWLAEPRESANFGAAEKIVIRQTSDTLIAALDRKKFICMNSLHVLTLPPDSGLQIEYLLALINSRLLDYYHYLLNPEKKEVLPEVKKENVARLPIMVVPPAQQAPLVVLVREILAAHAADPLADTSEQEAELDTLVYALYGVPPASIAAIDASIGAETEAEPESDTDAEAAAEPAAT